MGDARADRLAGVGLISQTHTRVGAGADGVGQTTHRGVASARADTNPMANHTGVGASRTDMQGHLKPRTYTGGG
jgi:hypothetical protein